MVDFFLRGGPIMYPLLVCSIISLTMIIERSIFWITEKRRHSPELISEVMELCRTGDWETIRVKVKGSKDYVIRVLVSGILHRDFSLSKAMEVAAAEEIKRMKKSLDIMDTMITVSPLIGILGTVVGIIVSFDMLGNFGIENPQSVTAGIAQAFITTVAGLSIAIFTVFPFNYFNSKVEEAATTLEVYATTLEIIYKKLDSSKKNSCCPD